MQWLLRRLYLNWVASRKTRMRRFLKEASTPGETRCKTSWEQFKKYGSLSLRYVKQVSWKSKDHRLEKYKSNILISEVPTLWSWRTNLQERLQDKSDAPAETRGDLPKNIHAQRKGQSYKLFAFWLVDLAGRIHNKLEEGEFVVDSEASMHMVSKKDLNAAKLETMRISKKSDDGNDGQRNDRCQRGNSVFQRIGFIRDSNASWRYTGSSLTWKNLRRSREKLPLNAQY